MSSTSDLSRRNDSSKPSTQTRNFSTIRCEDRVDNDDADDDSGRTRGYEDGEPRSYLPNHYNPNAMHGWTGGGKGYEYNIRERTRDSPDSHSAAIHNNADELNYENVNKESATDWETPDTIRGERLDYPVKATSTASYEDSHPRASVSSAVQYGAPYEEETAKHQFSTSITENQGREQSSRPSTTSSSSGTDSMKVNPHDDNMNRGTNTRASTTSSDEARRSISKIGISKDEASRYHGNVNDSLPTGHEKRFDYD